MREVAQELTTPELGRLERRGHVVERGSEDGKLIGARDGDALTVASERDPLCGHGEPGNRPYDPHGKEPTHCSRREGRRQDRDPERKHDRVVERFVEMARDVIGDDAESVADVRVKETGCDGQRHERERDAAGHDDESLCGEQLGRQAPAKSPHTVPAPMR